MTLEITLNYEETFLGSFNGNHDEAVAAIETALTHAQAVFFDESLHTRIVQSAPQFLKISVVCLQMEVC